MEYILIGFLLLVLLESVYGKGYKDGIKDMTKAAKDTYRNCEAVIHCKDCIHRDDGKCPMEGNNPWYETDDDGFCSHGERREAHED